MQFDAQIISHCSKENGRTLIDVCDSDLHCCTEDVENRKSLVKEAATRSVRTIFLSFSHSLSSPPRLMEISAALHSAAFLCSNRSSVWHTSIGVLRSLPCTQNRSWNLTQIQVLPRCPAGVNCTQSGGALWWQCSFVIHSEIMDPSFKSLASSSSITSRSRRESGHIWLMSPLIHWKSYVLES